MRPFESSAGPIRSKGVQVNEPRLPMVHIKDAGNINTLTIWLLGEMFFIIYGVE